MVDFAQWSIVVHCSGAHFARLEFIVKDIVAAVGETPVPALLIIAGLTFLLLSMADKDFGQIQVAENHKTYAMVLGAALFCRSVV